MLADAPLAHLLHRRPRTLSLPTGHAPIASGGSNSCRVGYLPPPGSTCPFHGARFLRASLASYGRVRAIQSPIRFLGDRNRQQADRSDKELRVFDPETDSKMFAPLCQP